MKKYSFLQEGYQLDYLYQILNKWSKWRDIAKVNNGTFKKAIDDGKIVKVDIKYIEDEIQKIVEKIHQLGGLV